MSVIAEDPDLLRDFLTEAGELLDDVDVRLVELERRPEDSELLNRVFRGFHTIKGGAGFLEATALVELCHRTENLFDRLRSNELKLTAGIMDHILAATAEVRRMFGEMSQVRAPTAAPEPLLAAIAADAKGETAAAAPSPALSVAAKPAPEAATREAGPDWAALHAAIAGVSAPPPAEPAADPAIAVQESVPAPAPAPAPAATPAKAKVPGTSAAQPETTIRVDTARFDRILTLSGEIGLARNRLDFLRTSLLRTPDDRETLNQLDVAVNRLDMLVGDLQSVVMKSRMQPVGRVSQKYARVARDLARQLGKELDFVLEGEETEIDKTILEKLNDPLVHLVRNSVDHGIETPAERRAAGKPERGTLLVRAHQVGDRIEIQVRDDGKGMSAEKLRAKAVEKGLMSIDEAASLDERQSLAIIFMPGFSTKDKVSDVSGRGVGMDVVRTNIDKLKGRVDIESRPGHGTCVTISLPLTLAILPVLSLRIGEQPFAMPLTSVREVINIDPQAVQEVSGAQAMLIRGEVLPVVDLAQALGMPGGEHPDTGIVTRLGGRTVVLRADAVIGQDEVMIKPLDGLKPHGVAGATISGDGVVVLVLELDELLGQTA